MLTLDIREGKILISIYSVARYTHTRFAMIPNMWLPNTRDKEL